MPKTKKGHFRDIFGEKNPFFRPESSVFEIALVILVGVCTHEKILRPTQNPTLAGMDPLHVVPEARTGLAIGPRISAINCAPE